MKTNPVYSFVTEKIMAALSKGEIPWRRRWRTQGLPMNFVSKKAYRGINLWLLSLSGFSSPYWLTYNQAKAKGGQVKKGEKGSMVVFYKLMAFSKDKADGTKEDRKFPFLRYYNVFNLEQCEGIKVPVSTEPVLSESERIAACEAIVEGMKDRPEIIHGGGEASYCYSTDKVRMPKFKDFETGPEYYATLFHELTHSTRHARRLARKFDGEDHIGSRAFGSPDYSREELVAEMGASFLCGVAGVDDAVVENSAAYIQNWMAKLQSDPKFIVQAASFAQKAADYILDRKAADEAAEKEEGAE
jgi:antirestriction protein ArdC